MANGNGTIQSAIYIQGLNLTKEEQEQESAKFKAWYDSFLEQHGEELARIRSAQNGA